MSKPRGIRGQTRWLFGCLGLLLAWFFFLVRPSMDGQATGHARVELVRVQGDSMAPRIRSGDWIENEVGYYQTGSIARGDIVTLRLSGNHRLFVKRVVAIPGDRVRLAVTSLYVNDNLVLNSAGIEYEIRSDELRAQVELVPVVPEHMVLVMGEPRKGSLDSSRLGYIPRDAIVGRVRVGP